MKKSIFLSIVLMLTSIGTLFAQNTNPNVDLDFSVEIKPGQPIRPTIKPRTIVNTDIEAYYSYGELSLTFNVDLGNADIVVTNTTTGESWYDSVNGVGTASFTLSGDEGYYIINIYTDYDEYYGEFII